MFAKAFISHSSKDKEFVRTLKHDLNCNGIETWFDEDELELGDSLIERLEKALEGTTHFIIIISPHALQSDWVQYELDRAVSSIKQRIIPIHYRECPIPPSIAGLIYGDLTKEVVRAVDDKIKFATNGYEEVLKKLVNAVRSAPDKKLSTGEKEKMVGEFRKEILSETTTSVRDSIATLFLQVDGYGSTESKQKFKNRIIEAENSLTPSQVKPILFPRILKHIFKDLEIGHEYDLLSEYSSANVKGHFAGFRRDDTTITIDIKIRKEMGLSTSSMYYV